MTEIVAIFDLEGTLCRSGSLVWKALLKKRLRKFGGIFHVASHIIHLYIVDFLRKRGFIKEHRAHEIAIESMISLLGDCTVIEIDELAETISREVVSTLRPDMQKILDEHREQGHKVLLASNLFQPFLEHIGRGLGVTAVVGTGLETKGSRYTGKASTAICFDEQRVSRLREYITENGLEVDLSQSYAYGDTKWDRPVLEMVGNPAAVYPDAELRTCAQGRGWRIIE